MALAVRSSVGFNTVGVLGIRFFILIIHVLYFAMMESSKNQGTVGKLTVGLKVCDQNQEKISFPNAISRTFGKVLSAIPLLLGFIWAGIDKHKQGFHDKLAGTYVVYK